MTDIKSKLHIKFRGKRLLLLGFGSVASTFLPLLLRHIDIDQDQILIASDGPDSSKEMYGLQHQSVHLTPENHVDILKPLVEPGDCIVNLTGGVSAIDMVRFCLHNAIDYIDTSNERWEHGGVYNDSADFAQQWVQLIGNRDTLPKSATALVSHGANPGLVSHFAKQAVENLATREGYHSLQDTPDWPKLAMALDIEAIHISECDSQITDIAVGPDDFYNTWSVEGLVEEGHSTPCFAWGTHESQMPGLKLREDPPCIVARFPGFAKHCKIRSWLPEQGEFEAAIIPHEEAFSIAELFSCRQQQYQPSVLFAYQPCPDAFTTLHSKDEDLEKLKSNVLMEEITSGVDELGTLILRRGKREVYWYGSTLDIHSARKLVPCANATSLQVAAGVLGGLVWLLENPGFGLVSAEDTNHHRVLEVAKPYLGELHGVDGVWHNAPENWQMRELLLTVYD